MDKLGLIGFMVLFTVLVSVWSFISVLGVASRQIDIERKIDKLLKELEK